MSISKVVKFSDIFSAFYGFRIEELNRCAVDFPYFPFFGQNTFPILFNRDISSLVDRVESQYNFLCHSVGISWRKSKSKEVV
jgi:hypothetical protein